MTYVFVTLPDGTSRVLGVEFADGRIEVVDADEKGLTQQLAAQVVLELVEAERRWAS